MPTIFKKDGYRFFFYSNEHLPIHVHVTHGGGEAIFYIGDKIVLKDSHEMNIWDTQEFHKLPPLD